MTSFDEEYEAATASLEEFGEKIVSLLKDLLRSNNMAFHNVDFRVKEKESASRKLTSSGNDFASVEELYDLLGVRIITYFVDNVDTVGKMVRKEFSTDSVRSVDKRSLLDPDRFGYLSLHYIASISRPRIKLPEWALYGKLEFELQIRSILQHSWAEIEHDLGYKSPTAIPDKIRRRFSRLAGVLEMADDEYKAIRTALEAHAKSVDNSVKAGRSTLIDRDSIASLSLSSAVVRETDLKIASATGYPLEDIVAPGYADKRAEDLRSAGLKTTGEVTSELELNGAKIAELATRWFNRTDKNYRDPIDELSRGISLFYLYLHLEASKGIDAVHNLRLFTRSRPQEAELFYKLHQSIFNS